MVRWNSILEGPMSARAICRCLLMKHTFSMELELKFVLYSHGSSPSHILDFLYSRRDDFCNFILRWHGNRLSFSTWRLLKRAFFVSCPWDLWWSFFVPFSAIHVLGSHPRIRTPICPTFIQSFSYAYKLINSFAKSSCGRTYGFYCLFPVDLKDRLVWDDGHKGQ